MSAHTLIAPEGDAERRRHAHTRCVLAAREAGTFRTYDDWRATQPRRPGLLARLLSFFVLALLAGCGSSSPRAAQAPSAQRLTFAYDRSQPLDYANRGRISAREDRIKVEDVSFRSGALAIEGYVVLPPGRGTRPAVILVHGSGGDRNELLEQARRLAERNIVALTITEPSTSNPPARGGSVTESLRRLQSAQVRDVVAVRRGVDLLQSLPGVDPKRIGYLGWSAGARGGTFVAASEPRVKALALLSAGAAPIRAYVENAPPALRRQVRPVLTRIDPIRYIRLSRSGRLLLEDGRRDEIVPRSALLNVIRAAPHGTKIRWYDAPHALNAAAYRYALAWLGQKLRG